MVAASSLLPDPSTNAGIWTAMVQVNDAHNNITTRGARSQLIVRHGVRAAGRLTNDSKRVCARASTITAQNSSRFALCVKETEERGNARNMCVHNHQHQHQQQKHQHQHQHQQPLLCGRGGCRRT